MLIRKNEEVNNTRYDISIEYDTNGINLYSILEGFFVEYIRELKVNNKLEELWPNLQNVC